MKNRFYEGQHLASIFWAEGTVTAGKYGYKDIVVVMENSEAAGVPWAMVENEDGRVYKYNLNMCEGCILKGSI